MTYHEKLTRTKLDKSLVWEIWIESNGKLFTSSYYLGSERKRTFEKKVETEKAVLEAYKMTAKKLKQGYVKLLDEVCEIDFMPFSKITYKEFWIDKGCFQQPRLNGLRCLAIYKNEKWILFDKDRRPLPNLQHVKIELNTISSKKDLIYDGILTHPNGNEFLHTICKDQKKEYADIEKDTVFNIFDIINCENQYSRLELLFSNIGTAATLIDSVRIVETIEVSSVKDILQLHKIFLEKGYKGSIVRAKSGFYSNGYCAAI